MLLAAQGSFAVSDPAQLIEASEQGMYAADFDRATTALNAALAGTAAGGDARLALLLQKLRVQQNARLAGVTLDDENATMVEITTLAQTTRSRDLIGQAALRLAVSRYFTNLLADDTDRVINFVPEFRAAAQMIDAPCRRTEALFFVGLMPQIVGLVASSKADLEAAQTYAKKCPLEQSYIDRHLAAVADDAGDLAAALELARRSSEERRRIGFKIFLPFSLLLEADLEERNGNRSRAQALLLEAAKLSAQLKLSASQRAACAAVAEHKLSSGHC
jgi:hypothetical protein